MIYMNLNFLIGLALVISDGLVVGQETFGDGADTGNEFMEPDFEDDDVRSPCPAINTLANHGFINRNGKMVQVDELAEMLQFVYGVSSVALRNGPVEATIESGLTEELCVPAGTGSGGGSGERNLRHNSGSGGSGSTDRDDRDLDNCESGETDEFLSIDRLFETEDALEHDSSFIREDNGQYIVDDRFPSTSLITGLLDDTSDDDTSDPLSMAAIMAFQVGRINDSCNRRVSNMMEESRTYTGEHLAGMAIQGALIFVLAQRFIEDTSDPFTPLGDTEQAKLRSILALEMIPMDYVLAMGPVFTFATHTEADDVRDVFRASVEAAIDANGDCER